MYIGVHWRFRKKIWIFSLGCFLWLIHLLQMFYHKPSDFCLIQAKTDRACCLDAYFVWLVPDVCESRFSFAHSIMDYIVIGAACKLQTSWFHSIGTKKINHTDVSRMSIETSTRWKCDQERGHTIMHRQHGRNKNTKSRSSICFNDIQMFTSAVMSSPLFSIRDGL